MTGQWDTRPDRSQEEKRRETRHKLMLALGESAEKGAKFGWQSFLTLGVTVSESEGGKKRANLTCD